MVYNNNDNFMDFWGKIRNFFLIKHFPPFFLFMKSANTYPCIFRSATLRFSEITLNEGINHSLSLKHFHSCLSSSSLPLSCFGPVSVNCSDTTRNLSHALGSSVFYSVVFLSKLISAGNRYRW